MGEGPGIGSVTGRRRRRVRIYTAIAAAGVLGTSAVVGVTVASAKTSAFTADSVPVPATAATTSYRIAPRTSTPIRHVVVLFDENDSFDHYFGTYPNAANTDGSTFHAKRGTPKVNGLTPSLLDSNPNAFNPKRLSHSQALTCDQNHSYGPEEKAFDLGQMDLFEQNTATDTCTGQPIEFGEPGLVMDYYDGNTVTALWNYAQNYAMSDNNYDTNFGPSTPGALNLISGHDGGGEAVSPTNSSQVVPDPGSVGSVDSSGVGTIYGDLDPAFDDCSDSSHTSSNPVGVMTGKNVGDLLNAEHVTWGWFQGGFAPTSTNAGGYQVCGATHQNIGSSVVADYSPHHEPFQYFKSTANPRHLPPSSEAEIGQTDQANHQYDLSLFAQTLAHGNLLAVSFLKAAQYQDGHPGYSDSLGEQNFIVNTVNETEHSKYWLSTAIIITYDDSDGWYDHQASPIVNGSKDPALDIALCSAVAVRAGTRNDRCGYGPRLPLVVISPWTRDNFVSHNLTDQSSVTKFIEDNWLRGERIGNGSFDSIAGSLDAPGGVLDFRTFPDIRQFALDPATGEIVSVKF
ncbi:MAG: alkaline phosphatase family protein [Actinomycetota bacterium]|nr:alkaline phosphatase family protein [Actinomycetota bacterium]